MTQTDNPWSFPVAVATIPETGLHQDFEADVAQRGRLADLASLRDVTRATASFDLIPAGDGAVHVTGRVTARVGQTCVVSLEPVDNDITEDIDVVFAPPGGPAETRVVIAGEGEEAEPPEPPEPIVNGVIDLGRLATEFLILGIDPYPRKEGAVFQPPAEPEDPESHPFAALKKLKDRS